MQLMPPSTCRDPVGCFLIAYEEYLDGKRDYHDLPPAFGMCPVTRPNHEEKR